MDSARTSFGILRWQNLRWVACFALAVTFHGAGAAALLTNWRSDDDLAANAPVITVNLAPIAVSPTTTPADAPDPTPSMAQEAQPEPEPEKPVEEAKVEPEPEPEKPPEKVEVPPDPTPEPELAVLPPPKPVENPQEKKKRKHKVASRAAAPSAADQKADQAAAPTAGASGRAAIANWMSQLYATLQRYKRSPSDGTNGTVLLGFAIDRSGGVHNAHIVRSSGSSALDQEALAIVARAAPLPPPPPEKPGSRISITVPIRYSALR